MKEAFFTFVAISIPVLAVGGVAYMFLHGVYRVVEDWRLSRELRQLRQQMARQGTGSTPLQFSERDLMAAFEDRPPAPEPEGLATFPLDSDWDARRPAAHVADRSRPIGPDQPNGAAMREVPFAESATAPRQTVATRQPAPEPHRTADAERPPEPIQSASPHGDVAEPIPAAPNSDAPQEHATTIHAVDAPVDVPAPTYDDALAPAPHANRDQTSTSGELPIADMPEAPAAKTLGLASPEPDVGRVEPVDLETSISVEAPGTEPSASGTGASVDAPANALDEVQTFPAVPAADADLPIAPELAPRAAETEPAPVSAQAKLAPTHTETELLPVDAEAETARVDAEISATPVDAEAGPGTADGEVETTPADADVEAVRADVEAEAPSADTADKATRPADNSSDETAQRQTDDWPHRTLD